MSTDQHVAAQHEVCEIDLNGLSPTLSVDVVFVDPAGKRRTVPAFQAGGRWKVRYAAHAIGAHAFEARGVESTGALLSGTVRIVRADHRGTSPPIRVARNGRHLEDANGNPFLWLADTWWHGLVSSRISNEEFRALAAKRSSQGFSVVQLVAGFSCELVPFSAAGAEWPWREGFSDLNASWWQTADERIKSLLEHRLLPCIVGAWGYYYGLFDETKMQRHWREIVARWGAYPVVWCIAGEPPLVWYDHFDAALNAELAKSDGRPVDDVLASVMATLAPEIDAQLKRINSVARALKSVNAFDRPVTIHSVPGVQPWTVLVDEGLADFWLLQTGHEGPRAIGKIVHAIDEALMHEPTKPVINGEANYEGISGSSESDVQRFLFWSHLLSGTAGHSYGAHGVWGFNSALFPGQFSGLAPDWRKAAEYPGAAHVGIGRRALMELGWQKFEAHPEWITPHGNSADWMQPYAAGTDSCRVFYFPSRAIASTFVGVYRLNGLGGYGWTARYFDPRTGEFRPEFLIAPDSDGAYKLPDTFGWPLPSWEDWLLVLQPAGS